MMLNDNFVTSWEFNIKTFKWSWKMAKHPKQTIGVTIDVTMSDEIESRESNAQCRCSNASTAISGYFNAIELIARTIRCALQYLQWPRRQTRQCQCNFMQNFSIFCISLAQNARSDAEQISHSIWNGIQIKKGMWSVCMIKRHINWATQFFFNSFLLNYIVFRECASVFFFLWWSKVFLYPFEAAVTKNRLIF